jgi:hypothetical protein
MTASGLTIEDAGKVGLVLRDGAQADIGSLLVRSSARYGIVTEASRIAIDGGLVSGHGLDGIALLGVTGGAPHRLARFAASGNGVTGVRVERGVLEAERLLIQGTHVPEGTSGGDGLYAGDGARVILDAMLTTDGDRGNGSRLVANARTGALAAGMGTELDVRGALIGSNEGPGVFLQDRAVSNLIGFSILEDNGALGIGVASQASILEIPCDMFRGTRTATLRTTAGDVEVGDGVSIVETPAGTSTNVHGNLFLNNERFACVMTGSDATLRDNTGEGNGFPPSWYVGVVDADASNVIGARNATPDAPPATATGMIDLSPHE